MRLQHHDIEAFRRTVHGRREPRGSSPDDDQVPDLGVINRLVEAKTVGDLPMRGVPQHHLTTADDDRHVVDSDLETIQQRLGTGIPVEVDGGVRMAVARQERLDAECASRMTRSDEHNVAEGWSVIVKGIARMLRTDDETAEAERAQLLPWTATLKTHYVRVIPTQITGRRFQFGSEPDRESTFA